MLLFPSLTQFMGAVTILLVKIALKSYLSSLSLILTMANSKRTVYMCLRVTWCKVSRVCVCVLHAKHRAGIGPNVMKENKNNKKTW